MDFGVEWSSEAPETLAHTSVLRINSKRAAGPHYSISARDSKICWRHVGRDITNNRINVAGEALTPETISVIGRNFNAANALLQRLRAKIVRPHTTINLVFPRIPIGDPQTPYTTISPMQVSALVDVQLEAGADAIIPPLPGGLADFGSAREIIKTTQSSIDTLNQKTPILGYLPCIKNPILARDVTLEYLRLECRMFAVDFGGAQNVPFLLRTAIRTIRKHLKGEPYYIHAFNVCMNKKSSAQVSPITDLLTHIYGIDSVSSMLWGGSQKPEKLRYALTSNYGAYRRDAIQEYARTHGALCNCPVCRGHTIDEIYQSSDAQEKLKVHRIAAYEDEYRTVNGKIEVGDLTDAYLSHLNSKTMALEEIHTRVNDVQEIKAGI